MVKAPTTVGVIGGGSAGYLTALALRARCPEAEVAVVESSRVPTIGVGEGTTPTMVPFLHDYIGLDVAELVAEVEPTWKLGVRLDWGAGHGDPFQFPFAAPHLVDSYIRTGSINQAGVVTELMNRSAGLHALEPDLSIRSLTGSVPFAYHLDNQRFVRYLAHAAEKRGVRHVEAHLVDHSLRPDGSLEAVLAEDGRQLEFDLFVDCTGFRSTLLGDAMEVAFNSFASSLFTDAAVVGSAPHQHGLAPLTGSDTMDAGWCWSVPQLENDHRGYVFSTSHISVDAAEAELRHHCPGLGDTRLVKFTSGRRQRWWERNVVAIGNSYGFVEPLQATALHMIVHEITVLVQQLRAGRSVDPTHDDVNRHMAAIWEDTRALIALHYRHNHRRMTPFWTDAHTHTDLGAIGPVIDEAINRGSMTQLVELGGVDLLYGVARDIDLVLLGLQLVDPTRLCAHLSDAAWQHVQDQVRAAASQALTAADSVRIARKHPDSIDAREAHWFRAVADSLQHPLASDGSSSQLGSHTFLLLPDQASA
jgi:tryptophan 7-halogenase